MRKKKTQAEGMAPNLEPRRITPVEIQQKEFRLSMRGYNERDVDQFLDEVTEEIARLYADNKRLREEVEFSRTTRMQTSGAGESDAIVRQAREEAARIIAEATARASTIGAAGAVGAAAGTGTSGAAGSGASSGEVMSIFLARERAFLQNMANLIQAHAEGVKQDVRRVHEQVARPAPAPTPAPAPAPPTTPTTQPGLDAADAGGESLGEAASATHGHDRTEEPTQEWEATSENGGERAPSQPHDIVDLTDQEDAAELSRDDASEGSRAVAEERSGAQAAYSNASGRTSTDSGENSSWRAGESRPAAATAPKVEDEDAHEDRSIRELFWGED